MPINIKLNGEERAFDQNTNILSLLNTLNIPSQKVVVERNGEIIPKDDIEDIVLEDGDELDVIRFVGGG